MPLYNKNTEGYKENIIPIFENQYQMSGYVAQAFDKIYSNEYDYYIFMSEECLLNPCVKSSNLKELFKLDSDTCFISDDIKAVDVDTLNDTNWAFPSVFNITYGKNGAEIRNFIPEKAVARKLYTEKTGLKAPYLYRDYLSYLQRHIVFNRRHNHPFFFKLKYGNMDIKSLTSAFVSKLEKDKLITIYPLVGAEAEFFIISKNVLKEFAHYCGLFAAGRIHYNAAFATSLCFSANKIKMPKDLNCEMQILNLCKNDSQISHNLELRCLKTNTINLLNEEGENVLMAYPVSLNKWNLPSAAGDNE